MSRCEIPPDETGIVSWWPSPRERGTWDLLYSCTFTLLLCVYTALHLNIPPPGHGKMRLLLTKAQWILIGLLAPEIVLWTALDQWRQARAVRDAANRHMTTPPIPRVDTLLHPIRESSEDVEMQNIHDSTDQVGTTSSQKHATRKWSNVDGFFAVMGGFAFDASSMSPKHKRLTVSPSGIKLLAEVGSIPEISLESIQDKSKADVLAKLLVICQTLWLVLQCIGRKLNALPISILEVHTVVHVVCALGMYAFWFNKPLEVHDPMMLNGEGYEEMLAYMMMVSPELGLVDTGGASAAIPESALLSFDNGLVDKGKSTATDNNTTSYGNRRGHKNRDNRSVPVSELIRDLDADFDPSRPRFSEPHIFLRNGITDSESGFSWKETLNTRQQTRVPAETLFSSQPRRFSTWSNGLLQQSPTSVSETHKMIRGDVQRWRLASRAIRKHPWLEARARFGIGAQDIMPIKGPGTSDDDYIDTRIEDKAQALIQVSRPNFDFPFSDEAHQAFYNPILMIFPILYGALHFSAYNFTFPTKAEDALWYFSSLYIMASSWLILMIFKPSLTAALVIFGIPYLFSRFFLVIEAFISLRGADVGIYRTVIWAELIPHF